MIRQACLAVLASAALGACAYLIPKTSPTETAEPVSLATYSYVEVEGEKATAAERAACDAAGGEVRRDGLLGHEQCIQMYPDAGQSCSDADDCLGGCHAANEGSVRLGEAAKGVCEADDSPFGCFTTISDGRAEGTLCVD